MFHQFLFFLATVTLVAGMVISFLDPTLTPFIKTLDVRFIYIVYSVFAKATITFNSMKFTITFYIRL